MIKVRPLALAVALLCPPPLQAEPDLRAQDVSRLNNFQTAAGDALLRALANGSAADVSALANALSGTPKVAFDLSLAGDWSCRTMKLGGLADLVVYTNFKCRFTLDNDGVRFEKLTGSQLTRGRISMREGRAIYAGVGFTSGQNPPDYAQLPSDFRSDGEIQADIAIFERVSETRARLMFPFPAVESDFDILELTR